MAVKEQDIFIHRGNKLAQWVRDTASVYEMAKLPANEAVRSIFFMLMRTIVRLSVQVGFDKDDYMELCENMWEICHVNRKDQSESDQ